MKKILSFILSLAMISALAVPAFATTLNAKDDNYCIMGFTDYGFVRFSYFINYYEQYTSSGSNNIFKDRSVSYTVESTRSDAPAYVNVSPSIYHYSKSGTKLHTYTLSSDSAIAPSNIFAFGHKSNSLSVTYPKNTTNYGSCGFAITPSHPVENASIYGPFSTSLQIDLATN